MHAVVMSSLEEYLAGALEPAAQREVQAHLSTCRMCSEEIHSMRDLSQLFVSLRSPESSTSEDSLDPSPGFYAGVMRQAGERRATPSFGGLFGFDFAFGRRVVFASLLTLAILGSYLVTRENQLPGGPSPEAVMAQQNSPSFDSAPAQDNMLVTLTAYEQH
jgi:anti-sigma factor RsiW